MSEATNNYDVLGIKGKSKEITMGAQVITITKIEPFPSDFYEVCIKVHYIPEGSSLELSQIIGGNFKRENGKIVSAGSAFTIINLFNAIGLIGFDSSGNLDVPAIENFFNSHSDNPLKVLGYLYPYESNGKTYTRLYKRMLPANSSPALLTKIFNSDTYVKQGASPKATNVNIEADYEVPF